MPVLVDPDQSNLGLKPQDWEQILGDDVAARIRGYSPSIAKTLDTLMELVCPMADQVKLLPSNVPGRKVVDPLSFFRSLLQNGFNTAGGLITQEEFDRIRVVIEPHVGGLISVGC